MDTGASAASDKPHEECGLFGAFLPNENVAHLCYMGMYALQHRGQESAGMAVSDGSHLTVVKDMGLVASVFDDRTLAGLHGHLAVGHTRYSTTGASVWSAAQPFYRAVGETEFALAHNGNLVNTAELAQTAGISEDAYVSDSDLVAELLGRHIANNDSHSRSKLSEALTDVLPTLRGGFSFVVANCDHLIGIRDPHGIWPLCLGRLDGGWVLASETPALQTVGARFERELAPGEMIVIDSAGCRSASPFHDTLLTADRTHLCVFEFIYFSRPDAELSGQSVYAARQRMGQLLAEESPVKADLVMPVPESGIPAAQGYAAASGIPYGDGLVKNRYIGRTFIAPSQHIRELGVRTKLNPIRANIENKRLVAVDDSIVRGTTTRSMVQMLRSAGAAEVHLRISSPPYKWPCRYGVDVGTTGELLAAELEVPEVADFLGVDSLSYLPLGKLMAAIGPTVQGVCDACLTGEYPIDLNSGFAAR